MKFSGSRHVWRLASSFPRELDVLWEVVTGVAERAALTTDGALHLEPSAAGEPHASLDVLPLVAAGTLEAGFTAGSFFMAQDPVLALQTFVPFGLDHRRHYAWLTGPGRDHAEAAWARAGVVALPCANTGAQMGGWFREPIAGTADFRGLRIRTAGLPALVLARLGAEVRQLPAEAIIPALAAGELDAADWIGPHDDARMGFVAHAPYYHHPGVLEPSAQLSLIVNAGRWAELRPGEQAALRAVCAEAGARVLARYDLLNPPALEELERAGARLVRFPDTVVAALRRATREVLVELAGANPEFGRALASYEAFAAAGRRWAALGEGAAAGLVG